MIVSNIKCSVVLKEVSFIQMLYLHLCRFKYMAVADNKQRKMPSPDDRVPPRGQALDYPESVLLIDPIEPEFKGEVCYLP